VGQVSDFIDFTLTREQLPDFTLAGGNTMAITVSNQQKMYLTTAAVLAFGVAAYGLGRVYPPLGPSAGTVAPAQRYVNSQVSEADVTLGDTSVPELMQTDAFELITKDPNLRSLAASPGFQAIASQPQVMAAVLANPQAFASLASNPAAFRGVAQAAQSLSQLAPAARAQNAGVLAAVWGHSKAVQSLASQPQVLAAVLANPAAYANLAANAGAFRDAASKAGADSATANAFKQLASNSAALAALQADPGVF
jgi:hypothetical protein